MKKRFAIIALILIFAILGTTACGLIPKKQSEEKKQEDTSTPEDPTPEDPTPEDPTPEDPTPEDPTPEDPTPEDPTPEDPTPEDPTPEDPKDPVHTHEFVEGKCECGEEDPDYVKPEDPEVLNPTTIYLVGDSTVCSFADSYYYPRYGYGTQLANYLDSNATVVNLALSGRSSKSFLAEANYNTLKSSLKEGDFLIIGFGHNDQKSDDAARFTDATLPYTNEASFGYYLYEYYIKLAQNAGATPILCTPIVRAKTSDDYSGSEGHVTATGDYAQAIRDLGTAVGVSVVDLTAITKAEYIAKGYDGAKLYHAVLSAKYDTDGTTVIPNWDSIDKTHLNIYGAKFVAYSLASELSKIKGIGKYVLADISAPTEADLVPLEGYVVPTYEAPDLENYDAPDSYATISDGWYGTAFGNTGGSPVGKGFVAKETTEGVFTVGQSGSSNNGKINSSSDGIAFLFRQISADQNFKISVTATIKSTASVKEAGFGLMLRDDCVLNQNSNGSINTNYVTAGILCSSDTACTALFSRENTALTKGQSFSEYPAVNSVYTMSIERIGQSVTVTVACGDKTVSMTHYDFDFFAVDNGYMYVGMFANRGTVVEFTNVEFEITGTSQGA